MNHAEDVAVAVLQSVYPGSQMRYCDDHTTGTHDFDLVHPDGASCAVEVTNATREARLRARARIRNPLKGGPFVPRVRCAQDWQVVVLPAVDIDRLRKRVDDYLADIEKAGLDRFFAPMATDDQPSVARIYRDLDVEAGWVTAWKPPRRIGITLAGDGGLVTGTQLQDAIAAEAAKRDNRRKLAGVTGRPRHLFVYIDSEHFLPWLILIEQHLPEAPPSLPPEVDVVWAATEAPSSTHFVVWTALNGGRWRTLGEVRPADPGSQ